MWVYEYFVVYSFLKIYYVYEWDILIFVIYCWDIDNLECVVLERIFEKIWENWGRVFFF